MRPLRKLVVPSSVLVVLLALYAAAGFLAVPHLVRSQALEFSEEHYGHAVSLGEVRFNPFTLVLEAEDFRFPGGDGQPLAAFELLLVNLELSSLWRRGASFKEIAIDDPFVRALVRKDGRLNLADLLEPFAQEARAEPDVEPARLFIDLLRVRGGSATFEDRRPAAPFTATLQPVSFELRDFSTTGKTDNSYGLHAQSAAGETFDWGGSFSLAPLSSKGQFRIGQVRLGRLWEYVRNAAPVDVTGGILDLDGSYEFLADDTATDLRVTLRELGIVDLAARPSGQATDAARLSRVTVSDARLELAKREVVAGKIAVEGGTLEAWRDETGRLNLMNVDGESADVATASEAAAATATAPERPASPPWTFAAPDIELEALEVRIEDREIDPAVEWKLAPLNLGIAGFSTAPGAQVVVTANSGVNEGGRLAAEASYAPDSGRFEGDVDLSGFDLTVLQPYLDRYTRMSLLEGRLSADLKATRAPDGALAASGDIQVDRLRTVDRALGEDFIKWDRARAEGIAYDSARNAFRIRTIKARAPYARVIIAPDETVNVAEILKPAQPEPALTRAERAVGLEPPDFTQTAVAIDSVVITNGSMNFADFWIQPNYAVSVQGLAGTVTGLSSDPDSRAKLELAGKVDRYAPATIAGELNLLSASLYTDIQMKFAGVELSSVTPYSGRFAGYKIEKGKLSIDVAYHVEDRRLEADQRFVIDQLQLGERVESPDAVKLPLRLAVALLKDRNGVIDIGLPISGSLDDPKFRIGPVIWKAFVGLLTKIATAPFALLGRLFGGGEEMNFVEFEAGTAALDPAAQEKLAGLQKALIERPALELEVPMAYSVELDGEALGRQRLEQALAMRASGGRKRVDPEDSVAVLADPARRHELLVEEFKSEFGEKAKLPPETLALDELKRKERTAERYAQANAGLEAALIAQRTPAPELLETLGKSRAVAIQDALLGDGQVDPSRVFVIAQAARPAVAAESRVQLELGLR